VNTTWISWCFEGMTPHQLGTVVPSIRSLGISATFVLTRPDFLDQAAAWQGAIGDGHDVLNGALLEAADFDGQLPLWTPQMIRDDLLSTQDLMIELFGPQALPIVCLPPGPPRCGPERSDYTPHLRSDFLGARRADEGVNLLHSDSPHDLWSLQSRIWHARTSLPAEPNTWTIFRVDATSEPSWPQLRAQLETLPRTICSISVSQALAQFGTPSPSRQSSE